jgi:hypothetical protein
MTWESLAEISDKATDETIAQVVRAWRNEELIKSDFTQLADSPVDKKLWATYRQELRDMTNNDDPKTWVFPVRPS